MSYITNRALWGADGDLTTRRILQVCQGEQEGLICRLIKEASAKPTSSFGKLTI